MRKYKITIVLIVCFVVLVFGMVLTKYKTYNELKNSKLNEIYEYWDKTYTEAMAIVNLSIIDGCNARCVLIDDSELQFTVMYWDSENKYIDSYLQTYLEKEAEQFIKKQLESKYSDFNCYVQLLSGPPVITYDRLYSFYKQLNRPLSWNDELCKEQLADIYITVTNNNFKNEDAANMVDLINKLSIDYNHICIKKENDIIWSTEKKKDEIY